MPRGKKHIGTSFLSLPQRFLRGVIVLVKRIPLFVWGGSALFGAFFLGVMSGIGAGNSGDIALSPYQKELLQNEQLLELVMGYEQLNKLYAMQGENIGVVLDKDILYNHPEEVDEALKSIQQFRDLLLVEMGRIDQMRIASGLPPEKLDRKSLHAL